MVEVAAEARVEALELRGVAAQHDPEQPGQHPQLGELPGRRVLPAREDLAGDALDLPVVGHPREQRTVEVVGVAEVVAEAVGQRRAVEGTHAGATCAVGLRRRRAAAWCGSAGSALRPGATRVRRWRGRSGPASRRQPRAGGAAGTTPPPAPRRGPAGWSRAHRGDRRRRADAKEAPRATGDRRGCHPRPSDAPEPSRAAAPSRRRIAARSAVPTIVRVSHRGRPRPRGSMGG